MSLQFLKHYKEQSSHHHYCPYLCIGETLFRDFSSFLFLHKILLKTTEQLIGQFFDSISFSY